MLGVADKNYFRSLLVTHSLAKYFIFLPHRHHPILLIASVYMSPKNTTYLIEIFAASKPRLHLKNIVLKNPSKNVTHCALAFRLPTSPTIFAKM